jgi:membrane-associated protease RseP (regulator of RpoE activity)
VEERLEGSVSASGRSLDARKSEAGGDQHTTRLDRRLELLAAKLEAEASGRHRLDERLQALATELAALRGSGHETLPVVAAEPESVAAAPVTPTAPTAAPASTHVAITSMQHALVAAGIDPTTATEIRRRRDGLSLSEIYLRDQATREGWLETPDFAAKMAEIDRQRTSIREEIGDEAYDRYLAALDHPNRVAVNEVMLESPAAAAGIQAGDVVLRYGETRIFTPSELVTATRSGTAGETVRMEIIRQGRRFEIEVPRGPLGVSIAASRGGPGEG